MNIVLSLRNVRQPWTGAGHVAICVPLGCETELVETIVNELKERMKARGDTGNIKRAEQTIDMVAKVQNDVSALTAKVDLILKHLSIPAPDEMKR